MYRAFDRFLASEDCEGVPGRTHCPLCYQGTAWALLWWSGNCALALLLVLLVLVLLVLVLLVLVLLTWIVTVTRLLVLSWCEQRASASCVSSTTTLLSLRLESNSSEFA